MTDANAPKTLVDGFRRFRSGEFSQQEALYEELSHGQHPHTFVIACSDSRVNPAAVFNCKPGELFVVRNVANLVPPSDQESGGHSVGAALEYAVTVLKVQNVLVLGHSQCGGVRACSLGLQKLESEYLGTWLEMMEPARNRSVDKVGELNIDALSETLELHSVETSVERLRGYGFVADAIAAGSLEVHGARFSIVDGNLEWLQPDGSFAAIEPQA